MIRLLLILLTLFAFDARAAALDFVVRRNNANVDAYPDAGSDLLLLWDTAVANQGSGIVYSAGTFTLGETGHFLVMVSDRSTSSAITNRSGGKVTFNLAGSELREGYAAFWRRGAAQNADSDITFGAAIINVTTVTGNGDDLQFRAERSDLNVSTGHTRVASESGVTIIKLDDTWGFARYETPVGSPFNSSTTDNARVVATLSTTVEEDSPFTRTGNVIDIATTNTVMIVYTMQFVETVGGTNRHEYQSDIRVNGTALPGCWAMQYIRYDQDTDWESQTVMCLLYPTSGDDIDLGIITRELGEAKGWLASLQLWELPTGATTCTLEATTGDFNTADVDFIWDTVKSDTSADFTCVATSADIEAEFAGEAIVMAEMSCSTDTGCSPGERAAPGLKFSINTTRAEQGGHATYNRQSGTADHGTVGSGTLLTGIVANDDLRAVNIRLSDTTGAVDNAEGAFSAINLASLAAAPAVRRVETLVITD